MALGDACGVRGGREVRLIVIVMLVLSLKLSPDAEEARNV
jgi:hypothetical protein